MKINGHSSFESMLLVMVLGTFTFSTSQQPVKPPSSESDGQQQQQPPNEGDTSQSGWGPTSQDGGENTQQGQQQPPSFVTGGPPPSHGSHKESSSHVPIIQESTVSPWPNFIKEQFSHFKCKDVIEHNTGLRCYVNVSIDGDVLYIASNGIPDHETDTYPNSYNPNEIKAQDYFFVIPRHPEFADQPTELPMGPIGVAVNGVPFFNPWTAEDTDAVETETFDMCDGHPSSSGAYHYHKMPSSCVFEITDGEPSPLIGIALDGFPIYGPLNSEGEKLTSDDLDDCHGMFVDGKYQYHTTDDFPYILGCFKGVINSDNFPSGQSSNQQESQGEQQMPPSNDEDASQSGSVQDQPGGGSQIGMDSQQGQQKPPNFVTGGPPPSQGPREMPPSHVPQIQQNDVSSSPHQHGSPQDNDREDSSSMSNQKEQEHNQHVVSHQPPTIATGRKNPFSDGYPSESNSHFSTASPGQIHSPSGNQPGPNQQPNTDLVDHVTSAEGQNVGKPNTLKNKNGKRGEMMRSADLPDVQVLVRRMVAFMIDTINGRT